MAIERALLVVVLLMITLTFSGCRQLRYPDLGRNAIVFSKGVYVDREDNNALYATIVYDGRTYVYYGTLDKDIKPDDVMDCVGYIEQKTDDSDETRIYTLTADPENNFLMEYYTGTNLMNSPGFWRAMDTKGEDIGIPEYIYDLGNDYWK